MKKHAFYIKIGLVLLVVTLHTVHAFARTPFFSKGKPLEAVVIANPFIANQEDWVTMVTLQGLVARSSSEQIYFAGGNSKPEFLETLKKSYDLPVTAEINDRWELLERYKSCYSGYILYKGSTERNQATSLCGVLNGVAVEEKREAMFREKTGIRTVLADVRGKSERTIWNEYQHLFSPDFAAELDNDLHYHLRDYCVMSNQFVFTPNYHDTTFKIEILRSLSDTGGLFGYAEVANGDEYGAFAITNAEGIFPLGTNMVGNLSTMSSLIDDQLTMKREEPSLEDEEGVHYVTFMMSDGDNLAYNMWSQVDRWSSPSRGKFPVDWGMMPSTQELAPAVLKFFYDGASNNDHFFAQGGVGGIYPGKWPKERLKKHIEQVNRYMQSSDMRVLQFIDENKVWSSSAYWEPGAMWDMYTSQPAIDGFIFYSYGGGAGAGDVKFMNGKPIVMLREMLWDGLCDESQLTDILNGRMGDPYSKEGYSAVCVHVWTKGLDQIKQVIDQLNPNIRIVSSEEFLQRIKRNVAVKTAGAWGGVTPTVPGLLEAEAFDLGGEKVAYHIRDRSLLPENEIRTDEFVKISKEDNSYWVRSLKAEEFLRYTILAQNSRYYYVSLEAKSGEGGVVMIDVNGSFIANNTITIPANTTTPIRVAFPKSVSLSSRNEQTIRIKVLEGEVSFNRLEFTTTKPIDLNTPWLDSADFQLWVNKETESIIVSVKQGGHTITSVRLFDLFGCELKQVPGKFQEDHYIIQADRLPLGAYLVVIDSTCGQCSKKLMISK